MPPILFLSPEPTWVVFFFFFLSPCIFGRLPGEDASLNDAAVREGLGIAPDRRKNPASPTLQSETTKIDIIVQWGGAELMEQSYDSQ